MPILKNSENAAVHLRLFLLAKKHLEDLYYRVQTPELPHDVCTVLSLKVKTWLRDLASWIPLAAGGGRVHAP